MLPFFAFMHWHCCISSRYARCTTRGREARDNRVKPEDGVGGPILKMEGLREYMPEQEMLAKRVSYNKHLPSVGSQASHGAF